MIETKTKTLPKEQQYEKPEFEKLADEFMEADKRYLAVEEQFMNGNILKEMLIPGVSAEIVVEEFKMVIEEMKALLEDRNSKLTMAKNALRSAVQLGETQFRGPDGKPSILNYGPFSVSSVTRRTLDAPTLLEQATKRGFLKELTELQTTDNKGQAVNLVKQSYQVNYEGVVTWLKQRGLTEVVAASYEEADGTPMVKGPKKLAFLGEKKDE